MAIPTMIRLTSGMQVVIMSCISVVMCYVCKLLQTSGGGGGFVNSEDY